MAVEARHLNLFPPQMIITNRDFINHNQANAYTYNTQMCKGSPFTATMEETLIPFNQSLVCDLVQAKTSMKADSGLTYNLPVVSRKRSRDSMNQLNTLIAAHQKYNSHEVSTFVGDNISLQIQQQQLEIDHIVVQHSKKIRLELEERQKQHARLLVKGIGEGVMKKLKEKDEQIQRIAKLNLALQEKVKSLYVENQLWRDLAQTNEATAMSLRSNLEQVLAHVSHERLSSAGGEEAVAEEVESCCGSSDYGRDREDDVVERRTLAAEDEEMAVGIGGGGGGGGGDNRTCKMCGERESRVLLLPCRHLCLCAPCGTTLLSTCPVCNSNMNATVHVNMS